MIGSNETTSGTLEVTRPWWGFWKELDSPLSYKGLSIGTWAADWGYRMSRHSTLLPLAVHWSYHFGVHDGVARSVA